MVNPLAMSKPSCDELREAFKAMSAQERQESLACLCNDAFGDGSVPCDAYDTDMLADTMQRLRTLQKVMEDLGEAVTRCSELRS